MQSPVGCDVDRVEKVDGVPLHADGPEATCSFNGSAKAATSFACLEFAIEESLTLVSDLLSLLQDWAQVGVFGRGHYYVRMRRDSVFTRLSDVVA